MGEDLGRFVGVESMIRIYCIIIYKTIGINVVDIQFSGRFDYYM